MQALLFFKIQEKLQLLNEIFTYKFNKIIYW
jgi:hypothetical protein